MNVDLFKALYAHREEAEELLQTHFQFSFVRARKLVHGVLSDLSAGQYDEVPNPRRMLLREVRRIAVKGREL